MAVICLGRLLPAGSPEKSSSSLPAVYTRAEYRKTGDVIVRFAVSIFGLAGGGVCPADTIADVAVRSCRTISPLPVSPFGRPSAVCFLWHYPAGCPGWPLATTVPFPARTFLPRRFASQTEAAGATARPTHKSIISKIKYKI
jgi:hypothetical protein